MRALSIAAVLTLTLAGCATPDMSTWSAADIAAYQEREQAAYEQIVARGQQPTPNYLPAPLPAPQVGSYGQPNNTAVVYCNDVSASVTTCRQVR